MLKTLDVLNIWAKSQILVSDNTTLLMKYNHDGLISDLCAARMGVHGVAEEMLMSLKGRDDLPNLLVAFFEADEDKGCNDCWASSRIKEHPECDTKIKRWFDSREKLLFLCQLLNCFPNETPQNLPTSK
jgi:hypothetical protein